MMVAPKLARDSMFPKIELETTWLEVVLIVVVAEDTMVAMVEVAVTLVVSTIKRLLQLMPPSQVRQKLERRMVLTKNTVLSVMSLNGVQATRPTPLLNTATLLSLKPVATLSSLKLTQFSTPIILWKHPHLQPFLTYNHFLLQ